MTDYHVIRALLAMRKEPVEGQYTNRGEYLLRFEKPGYLLASLLYARDYFSLSQEINFMRFLQLSKIEKWIPGISSSTQPLWKGHGLPRSVRKDSTAQVFDNLFTIHR